MVTLEEVLLGIFVLYAIVMLDSLFLPWLHKHLYQGGEK